MLGELASYCAMAAGLVVASETECVRDPRGFVSPSATYLYANNWLQATYYQTMLTYLRELAGSGRLQMPASYKDHLNPEIAGDRERYVRSPGLTSSERPKPYNPARTDPRARGLHPRLCRLARHRARVARAHGGAAQPGRAGRERRAPRRPCLPSRRVSRGAGLGPPAVLGRGRGRTDLGARRRGHA